MEGVRVSMRAVSGLLAAPAATWAKMALVGLNSGAWRASARLAVPGTPIAVSWMLMSASALARSCVSGCSLSSSRTENRPAGC